MTETTAVEIALRRRRSRARQMPASGVDRSCLPLSVSRNSAWGVHHTGVMAQPMTDLPRVYVTVPGVEDLRSVIIMLRGAGAKITGRRREFVVEGPLTGAQAAATWQLAEQLDSGDGDRLDVRVDPPGDIEAALDVICPGGWAADSFSRPEESWSSPDRWWKEQQQLHLQRRRQS